jgi:hypothetical protein
MKKVLVVLLVLVVAVGAFAYFPRGGALEAINAAVLGVLNGDVDAARSGKEFGPALDGDVFATGDVVRANEKGRGVLTFFDASTVSVDPNSNVRVTSLARTSTGGLAVELEQTLGRTWTSVTKQTSSDAKFLIKTPTLTATVRGTAFETTVVKLPNGQITTTIRTSEGEVLVQAVAGGELRVGPGQQVDIAQGQSAPPAPQQQPPRPRLRVSTPAGVGFVLIDPRGYQCGLVNNATLKMAPHCDVLGGAGQSVVIGDVVAGVYTVVATAAQPVPNAAIVAEGLGVAATDFTVRLTRALAVGDLVRSTFTVNVGADGKLTSTGFSPADVLSSICGAEAAGRVLSSGELGERADLLVRLGRQQKGAPVALVYTQSELTGAAADAVAQASLPVSVAKPQVTVDGSGIHLTATLGIAFLSVPARGDIIAGSDGGKLVLRLRNLDAGIIPPAAKEQLVATIDRGLAEYAAELPITLTRVAFRSGCFALIGKTPS